MKPCCSDIDPMHTDYISNSVILTNDYVHCYVTKCFVCMHKRHPNEAIVYKWEDDYMCMVSSTL